MKILPIEKKRIIPWAVNKALTMTKAFLIFVFVLFITSCKKYPEGGFTRQGPKTFTTDKNGVWKLSLFEVNGVDSTESIPGAKDLPDYFSHFLLCSKYNCGSKKTCYYASASAFNYEVSFKNSNKEISFSNKSDTTHCFKTLTQWVCTRNLLTPELPVNETVWTILKLKDKECIITVSLKNNYKIILKR